MLVSQQINLKFELLNSIFNLFCWVHINDRIYSSVSSLRSWIYKLNHLFKPVKGLLACCHLLIYATNNDNEEILDESSKNQGKRQQWAGLSAHRSKRIHHSWVECCATRTQLGWFRTENLLHKNKDTKQSKPFVFVWSPTYMRRRFRLCDRRRGAIIGNSARFCGLPREKQREGSRSWNL